MTTPQFFSTLALRKSETEYALSYNNTSITFVPINKHRLKETRTGSVYDIDISGIARKTTIKLKQSNNAEPSATSKTTDPDDHGNMNQPADTSANGQQTKLPYVLQKLSGKTVNDEGTVDNISSSIVLPIRNKTSAVPLQPPFNLDVSFSPLRVGGDFLSQQTFRIGRDHRIYITRSLKKGTRISCVAHYRKLNVRALIKLAIAKNRSTLLKQINPSVSAVEIIEASMARANEYVCKWKKINQGARVLLELTADAKQGAICIT